MKLDKKQVKHIAELARLKLNDKEINTYTKELSSVLKYADQLNELDTGKISPKAGGTELTNTLRQDTQRGSFNIKALMKAAPFVEKGLIKVKSVFKK